MVKGLHLGHVATMADPNRQVLHLGPGSHESHVAGRKKSATSKKEVALQNQA
jgi:hypothetical protein